MLLHLSAANLVRYQKQLDSYCIIRITNLHGSYDESNFFGSNGPSVCWIHGTNFAIHHIHRRLAMDDSFGLPIPQRADGISNTELRGLCGCRYELSCIYLPQVATSVTLRVRS